MPTTTQPPTIATVTSTSRVCLNFFQVVRTAYDDKVEGQSVVPTRGFGDLYYKQGKDDEGNLLPPAQQVCCCVLRVHVLCASYVSLPYLRHLWYDVLCLRCFS